MTIGHRLQKLRLEHGKSQIEFADELGIGLSSYRYYEQDKREIPVSIIQKLCKSYKISADWLILGDVKNKPVDLAGIIKKYVVLVRKQNTDFKNIFTPEEEAEFVSIFVDQELKGLVDIPGLFRKMMQVSQRKTK